LEDSRPLNLLMRADPADPLLVRVAESAAEGELIMGQAVRRERAGRPFVMFRCLGDCIPSARLSTFRAARHRVSTNRFSKVTGISMLSELDRAIEKRGGDHKTRRTGGDGVAEGWLVFVVPSGGAQRCWVAASVRVPDGHQRVEAKRRHAVMIPDGGSGDILQLRV
jgi:hypothetical protein